jgi:hypothetical protein
MRESLYCVLYVVIGAALLPIGVVVAAVCVAYIVGWVAVVSARDWVIARGAAIKKTGETG